MIYIECYYADGGQILGNLDGQAAIWAKNYKRTNAYKYARSVVGNPKHMGGMVAEARVVTSDGRVLEVLKPPIH